MSAAHSSLAPHALISAQHLARVAAVQLAGSGMMLPHVAGAVPHSAAHAFSLQIFAAEQVHVPGVFAHAAEVIGQRVSLHAAHGEASASSLASPAASSPFESGAASSLFVSGDASGAPPCDAEDDDEQPITSRIASEGQRMARGRNATAVPSRKPAAPRARRANPYGRGLGHVI